MAPVPWPALASFAAAVGTVSLVAYLRRHRGKPGADWFLASLTCQALMSLAYGVALLVANPTLRWALEAVVWVTIAGTGVYFVLFATAYTGRAQLLEGWRPAIAALPAVVAVIVVTNPYHHIAWRGYQVDPVAGMTTVSYTIQPVALALMTAGIVAIGVGSLLLFDTVVSYGPLYRGEAVAVGLSTLPPLAALLVWAYGLGPVPELNFATVMFLPHVALDAYAFVGSDMFEFHPATRRAGERAAIDDLGTPVVIVDEQARVVTLNDAAESAFGLDKGAALTRPLAELLDVDDFDPTAGPTAADSGDSAAGSGAGTTTAADGDAATDGDAAAPTSDGDDAGSLDDADTDSTTVTVRREGSQSVYAVTSTPLTGANGTYVGDTVVFQDVTAERQREQRLNVLNRVLRHNLRNDMTVIRGFTEVAAGRVDDADTVGMLDRATDAADDLVALGEKAREVERVLDRDGTTERVELGPLLDRVVADRREEDHATVTVAAGDLSVRTDPPVLETVVGELLENALVHAGNDPTVELAVERRADTVAVTVSDDGPGIPDHERAAIDAGVESALEHGSGLGLWLANWGAASLGGSLVLDSDADGTTVTVELPAGEENRIGDGTGTGTGDG